jgi:hypothetical protein
MVQPGHQFSTEINPYTDEIPVVSESYKSLDDAESHPRQQIGRPNHLESVWAFHGVKMVSFRTIFSTISTDKVKPAEVGFLTIIQEVFRKAPACHVAHVRVCLTKLSAS